jgi:hypothetical protein
MTAEDLSSHLVDCKYVISTLGHGHTFSSMFGEPYFIVRDSVKLVVDAAALCPQKIRFIPLFGSIIKIAHDEPSWIMDIFMFLFGLLTPIKDNKLGANHLVVCDIMLLSL